jgi:hypothetical protein
MVIHDTGQSVPMNAIAIKSAHEVLSCFAGGLGAGLSM